MIWAVIWLVAFVAMCGGLAVPPHEVSGYAGSTIFIAMFVAGMALSLRVLT